jgi:isoleucyl-tRNA synthetase
MSSAPELKATLTLPQTAFPMKANLPQNEPLRLQRWASLNLYEELRKLARGRPAYLLHDGPPYANGPIHLGHALNKGLKDFVVKSRTMAGFDAPYVPGFDCHGLPIEIKVDEKLGRKKLEMPVPAVLDACRAFAQTYIDLQTEQFERIGCFGRWQNPYKTMARSYEARTLEAFFGFLEGGYVYRGLKPVYWCLHDRTALAEAEVEYENHTSPSVYVRYEMLDDRAVDNEEINRLLASYRVYAIIWTTTPWTLPASLAIAFHPDFDYVALAVESQTPGAPPMAQGFLRKPAPWVGDETPHDVYIVAASLADQVKAACHLQNAVEIARFKGRVLENTHYQHPFLDRTILGVLAAYVTADTGTGAVHTAPAHGADDFYTGQKYGLDLTSRVDAAGRIHVDPAAWHEPTPPPYDGLTVWKANPVIVDMLKTSGALLAAGQLEHSYPHCWRCHHPIIFRATEQWFIRLDTPMKRLDGSATTFRNLALEEIDKVLWDPAWGKERIKNMIATRPDWCISRQRIWGVPIAVFVCEGCNQPIVNAELNKRIVDLFDREGAEAWHGTTAGALLWDELKFQHLQECTGAEPGSSGSGNAGPGFRKETDILDVWFDSGVSWFAVCESDPDLSAIYKSFETQEDRNDAGTTAAGTRLPEGAAEFSPGQARAQRGGSPGNAPNKISPSPVGATESPHTAGAEVLYQGTTGEPTQSVGRVPNSAEKKEGALAPALPEGAAEFSPGQARAQRGGSPGNAASKMSPSPVGATESANPETPKPIEVFYLEGGDQHRGWFHSSLLTSVALRGRAPYSHVATAGWTLDEQGRAMSKSLGNGVDPVDIANRLGGEIVRLWVASVDWREDMAASENLMQRCAELYKKLRNTFRFLLGNLQHSLPAFGIAGKFDPARDAVPEADLLPLDRYMLAKTRDLAEKIVGPEGKTGWYAEFEFHRIYHAVNEFAIVDLSAFYLDVLKDRMYTFAPTSRERLSAQTVLWKITEALARLLAPILSFTADEVWEYLPAVEGREASVHLAQFPKPKDIFAEDPAPLLDKWKVIFEFRKRALINIEAMRQRKEIGKSSESNILMLFRKGSEGTHWFADTDHLKMMKEIMNVSEVEIKYVAQEEILSKYPHSQDEDFKLWMQSDGIGPQLAIEAIIALPARGSKCARCWNFMPHVSNYGIWENVCDRCQNALREMGIDPPTSLG